MHDSAGGIKSIKRLRRFYRPYVVTSLLLFVAVEIGCGERNSTPKLQGASGTRCIASDPGAVSEIAEEHSQSRLKEAFESAGTKERSKA